MNRKAVLILAALLAVSCNGLYSNNEDKIKIMVPIREKQKGINLKSFDITSHSEEENRITVYIKGVAERDKPVLDTLVFITAGDGILSGD
jgi:hypothetical protein